MQTKYIMPIGLVACITALVLVVSSGKEHLNPSMQVEIEDQSIVSAPLSLRVDQLISQELKQQIIADVSINAETLKSYKAEFNVYYRDEILPRINELELHITNSSIHMISPEVYVLWTEGLSPSAWGGSEFIYVISTEVGEPKIVSSLQLDPQPSRTSEGYRSSVYWPDPNKDCGYNDLVKGVLQYGAFGGSGSTFVQVYIGYNRYDDTYDIDTSTSPVFYSAPVCIE